VSEFLPVATATGLKDGTIDCIPLKLCISNFEPGNIWYKPNADVEDMSGKYICGDASVITEPGIANHFCA
jgi:hypothetical protein